MDSYDWGERVTATVTWTDPEDNDNPFDPDVVRVMFYRQYGDSVSYTFGVDAELTNPSTGVYECEYTPTQWGHWHGRWEAETAGGIMQDAKEWPFYVRRSWFHE